MEKLTNPSEETVSSISYCKWLSKHEDMVVSLESYKTNISQVKLFWERVECSLQVREKLLSQVKEFKYMNSSGVGDIEWKTRQMDQGSVYSDGGTIPVHGCEERVKMWLEALDLPVCLHSDPQS